MTDEMLIAMAKDARKNSYSPYSGFSVGAALLTSDGRVFCGCNIEKKIVKKSGEKKERKKYWGTNN